MAVIIFKAVEKCNSNCIYCDVIKKHQSTVMSYDLLEIVFRRIDEYLRENPDETVSLTWHGGEVCLLGAEYFERAAEMQEKYCASTHDRIKHLVQSNLTLINQRILDAFRRLGIRQIGSSYEPLPHIRGFGSTRDSDAYNRLFMKGVALLEENNITWGVIYVVHRGSLANPLKIFHYLVNLNLSTTPNFNIVWVVGDDPEHLAITPAEFADFLGAIFPYWWKHRERFANVKPFHGYVQNVVDRQPVLCCETSGACAYHWVYIGPEGDTAQCGKAGDYHINSYGRIQERSLGEILRDPRRDPLARRQIELPRTECRDCRFWGICHAGCPLDSALKYGDVTHQTPNCEATRRFMEKYFEPTTGARVELPPPQVLEEQIAV